MKCVWVGVRVCVLLTSLEQDPREVLVVSILVMLPVLKLSLSAMAAEAPGDATPTVSSTKRSEKK